MIDMLGSSMQKYNTRLPFSLRSSGGARRVRLLSGAHTTDARRRAALTRSRGGPYRKRVTRGIFCRLWGKGLIEAKKRPGLPKISATILCSL